MKFQTPYKFSWLAYAGLNTRAPEGEEVLGLSIGRFYVGYYRHGLNPGWPHGWCAGFLDDKGCL